VRKSARLLHAVLRHDIPQRDPVSEACFISPGAPFRRAVAESLRFR
jgi:hypothetical protein